MITGQAAKEPFGTVFMCLDGSEEIASCSWITAGGKEMASCNGEQKEKGPGSFHMALIRPKVEITWKTTLT